MLSLQTIFSDFLPLSFLSQYFNELWNIFTSRWSSRCRSGLLHPLCMTFILYIIKKNKQAYLKNYIRSKKEVFQPHLPVRLPCYDLAPVTSFALNHSSRLWSSSTADSHGLTGGVYKARERIHRSMADLRLLANPSSRSRVADSDPN